jgi:hypothetical protein
MKEPKNCPKALLHKLLFTALIGVGIFIIGTAYFIFSKDTITLMLSGLVLVFSLIKCMGLRNIITKHKYEKVEGTYVGVSSNPFKRQLTVKIMDDNGIESTLKLGKQTKLKIGFRYCFYFKQGKGLSVGNGYFDTALSSDSFLGFEELGEFITDVKP